MSCALINVICAAAEELNKEELECTRKGKEDEATNCSADGWPSTEVHPKEGDIPGSKFDSACSLMARSDQG